MGVVISPQSELGKELRKWEQHPTIFATDEDGDIRPGNPYVMRDYPKMIYKAQLNANGQVKCMDTPPNPYFFQDPKDYERACLNVETFNKSCYLIVKDEDQERRERSNGWRESPDKALQHYEAMQQDIAKAAAERHFADRRMSPQAQLEAKAADDATHEHVADVPVPVKRRGRPAKKKEHAHA